MGKQSNKVEKRRRRLAYLERKKAKLKEAADGNKTKLRRPAVRKDKEKRPAPAASETAGVAAAPAPAPAPPDEPTAE